jgi:hypothetical protein
MSSVNPHYDKVLINSKREEVDQVRVRLKVAILIELRPQRPSRGARQVQDDLAGAVDTT